MRTDGKSIRQEASLRTRASRTSFFSPRCPTPRDRTSVAATTRTSCPARFASAATRNASVQVSRMTQAAGRPCRKVTSLSGPPTPFADDLSISRADTDLAVLASHVNPDVLHSSALFAAQYRRPLERPPTSSFLIKPTRRAQGTIEPSARRGRNGGKSEASIESMDTSS